LTHAHHHHDHGHPAGGHVHTDNRARLWWALALIASFMVVEVVVGVIADSVALVADAGHMLGDTFAIGLSLVALNLAARPASGAMTFGLKRVEIFSAQFNGLTLLVMAGIIAYESIHRLLDPPDVGGAFVFVTAAIGAVVNLVVLVILSGADRRSLNIEGSYQHVLMDLLGSVAAIIAGLVVWLTGYDRADAIAALAVAALMIRSSIGLLWASSRVLLEAAPRGVDPERLGMAMAGHVGVVQVHDLHVWEVTSGFPALSAHVVVDHDVDCHAVRRDLERMLVDDFHIDHSTLQVEHAVPRLHGIDRAGP